MLKTIKAPVASFCRTPYILRPEDAVEVENVEQAFLDVDSFNNYLTCNDNMAGDNLTDARLVLNYIKLSDYIISEPKLGIDLDKNSRTAMDQMLYRVGMLRPESKLHRGGNSLQVSLLVDFADIEMPPKGLMKVGGEGKAVFYETVTGIGINRPVLTGKRFKLYLASPAVFENGWLPSWLDKETMTGSYCGINIRLLTAAVGKYVSVGGFDMQKKRPKTMRRAVPAGSVYYFELADSADMASVTEVFHGVNISEHKSSQEGFGLVFVGAVAG